ncbi:MAG: caspase family protein [Gallionella sp.]|nr:caspase family protein [Gallionella sp.]
MCLILRFKLPVVLAALVLSLVAHAAELPVKPMLRIDPGEHTGMIRSIASDEQAHYLVTASEDKTARVWSLADGRLLNTLRIPIGQGNEGKLNAVALSPDGLTVALGGWSRLGYEGGDMNNNIFLFDRASARLLRRLSGLPGVVIDQAFSPDGRYLAATMGADGLRLFSVSDGRLLAEDRDYRGGSYSVDFSRDGRLVTTCEDGLLRVYRFDGQVLTLLAKRAAPGGRDPAVARFSPDGHRIALGFTDTSEVNVLDAGDLSLAYAPDTRGANKNLGRVAWSQDGETLYAAGRSDHDNQQYIRRWTSAGKGAATDDPVVRNTISGLIALPGNRLAFASQDPAWGVTGKTGQHTLFHPPVVADFRDGQRAFTLSDDGMRVRYGYQTLGNSPVVFDSHNRIFLPHDTKGLTPPALAASGLNVSNWKYSDAPKLNGKLLTLKASEISRSLALLPNGDGFALGADWSLRVFDRDGQQRWQQAVPGSVWAVNVSGDGRYVVAAYGDGTIRWHQAASGMELLAFYPHPDRQRWVMWTPQGYYDVSGPDAENLIGWHVNKGMDQAAEFYPASRFRNVFYRPDVIQQVLQNAAPAQGLVDASSLLLDHPAPNIKLLTLPQQVQNDSLNLSLNLQDAGGGIGDVRVFINGTSVQAARGLAVTHGSALNIPVRLVPGKNEIKVMVFNAENSISSNPAEVTVTFLAQVLRKPNLHALVVGIQEFENPRLNLQYTRGDAEAVKQLLETRSKGLFEQVDVQLLTSRADTSKSAIEAAFARYKSSVAPDDVFLFYVASHGIIDGESMADKSYYLVTSNVGSTATRSLKQDALSQEELRRLIADVPATKKLVLLDTCHAGDVGSKLLGRGLDEDSAVKLLSRSAGIAVIAASTSAQQALEGHHGHGVFTYVLLEGMNGKADTSSRGYVTPIGLADYVTEQVPDVTERAFKSRQYPTFNIEGQPFPIVKSN